MLESGTPSETNGRPPLLHRSVSSIPSVPSMQTFVAGVEKTISYSLHDPSHGAGHRLGVLSIAMNKTEDTLFTGGRDGVVIEWDINSSLPQPRSRATYTYHTNWVNDLFVTHNEKHLLSCSSDGNVNIWEVGVPDVPVHAVFAHSDYVKVLANAPKRPNIFASGGLDGFVRLWDMSSLFGEEDMQRVNVVTECKHKSSIYALCISKEADLIISGSTDNHLRVWDSRSGERVIKMKGHKDIIRRVVMDDSGKYCLSASSDGTVRVWDLGYQCVVNTFRTHTGSVWDIIPNGSFSRALSAGADGMVYCTDLKNPSNGSIVVCDIGHPLIRMTTSDDWSKLWVADRANSVREFSLHSHMQTSTWADLPSDVARIRSHSFSFKSSVSSVLSPRSPRALFRGGMGDTHGKPSCVATPKRIISGVPGIRRFHLLQDRHQVVTEDTVGRVQVWDILKASLLEDLGATSFDRAVESRKQRLFVPSWCSVDTKLGNICVHMEAPKCFDAHVYAVSIGFCPPNHDEDLKANMGESVLLSIFDDYLKKHGDALEKILFTEEALIGEQHSTKGGEEKEGSSSLPTEKKDSDSKDGEEEEKLQKAQKETESSEKKENPSIETSSKHISQGLFFGFPPETSVVISEKSNHRPIFRSTISSLCDYDPKDVAELCPLWALNVLFHGVAPESSPRVFFYVKPSDLSQQDPSGNTRLSAPRIVRVKKVMGFVASKLELAIPTVTNENGEKVPMNVEDFLEIWCGDECIDPSMNMGTLKWCGKEKTPTGELILRFSTKSKPVDEPTQ